MVQSIWCRRVAVATLLRQVAVAALLLCTASLFALAAEPSVPYVPTPQDVVERMLQIARVGPGDYVIDLGSGDGRIVVTAAKKFGARGFGVDLSPDRIKESNENARKAGVTDRAAFYQRNLFETDLSQATVITMYLLPRVNIELRPKLLQLRPGTRVVSHDFSMDDWKPDTQITMETPGKWGGSGGQSDIYFWVIPAKIAGAWRWELTVAGKAQPYEVTLDQKFQVITGTARIGGRTVKLQDARLNGDDFHFSFMADVNGTPLKHEFSGKVEGDSIDGSATVSGARVQGQQDWNARRTTGSAGAAQRTGAPRLSRFAQDASS
jgi:methyltransferase family protein